MSSNYNFSAIITMIFFCFFSCEKKSIVYNVPTSYNFENVNYEGQSQRIEMLKELIAYVKSATDIGASSINEATILNMYANINSPFSDVTLNQADIQLKNKTNPDAQEDIEACIQALEVISQNTNKVASVGDAGVMVDAITNNRYLLNANGVEVAEVLEKLIIGATFYYQITAVYLGENKINTDNKGIIAGRGTNMEHHWDEAFGYFGVPITFPNTVNDLSFLGSYANKTNAILGYNSKIMNAFLEGRAAISAKDYPNRDAARETLKTTFETLIAATAISNLNDAIANAARLPLYYHNLSKAYATIMSLKYGAYKTLSDTEIDTILMYLGGSTDPLQTSFYTATRQGLNNAIDALASPFPNLITVKNSL